MAKTSSTNTLTMKLLVDTKSQRVLFAEAGKDVVDFLFSLLALPAATTVKLVGERSMVGSVGSLYASVEKLDSTYLLPGAVKTSLLRPAVASPAVSNNSSLLLPAPSSELAKKFFKCSFYQTDSCYDYVTEVSGTSCPVCRRPMTKTVHYVPPKPSSSEQQLQNGKGFVQGVVTYTVTDDLAVTPMSAISSIALLNTFAVTDLSALQEMTVQIGYKEGVEILRAALQSKTVLTDVFLDKKASPPS